MKPNGLEHNNACKTPILIQRKEWFCMARRNQLLVPQAERAMNSLKKEISQEFGVELGADATARANGSVGGEMTKRLVSMAQRQLKS
jgi:hypothetical protein